MHIEIIRKLRISGLLLGLGATIGAMGEGGPAKAQAPDPAPATAPAQAPAQTPAQPPAQPPKQAPATQTPEQGAGPAKAGALVTQQGSSIKIYTTNVVVPVTVKDKQGTMVAGLHKDDFRIFEDNIEQQITSMKADPVPLSMVVLIDNDLKQKDADQVRDSLPAILAGMSLSDEADICRFDQFFYPGKGFTKDQDKILVTLNQIKRKQLDSQTSVAPPGGPFNGPSINGAPAPGAGNQDPSLMAIKGQPTKALDDAVFAAAELLKDRPEGRRKVILLISDGKNGAKFNTHKFGEVKDELARYGIIVYSVATGTSYFDRKFTRLVEYATATGGDVSYGAKAETFEEFYQQITDQARNQYTLTYSPKAQQTLGFHSIEVRVERPDLVVIARKGYFGGTPQ